MIPEEAVMLTNHLFWLKEKMGIPDTLTADEMNLSSWTFLMEVVKAWKIAYPAEYAEWIDGLVHELSVERPIKQAIKGGGFTPIAYPERVFHLLKVFFPKLALNDRKFIRGLVYRIPELKTTNYTL